MILSSEILAHRAFMIENKNVNIIYDVPKNKQYPHGITVYKFKSEDKLHNYLSNLGDIWIQRANGKLVDCGHVSNFPINW